MKIRIAKSDFKSTKKVSKKELPVQKQKPKLHEVEFLSSVKNEQKQPVHKGRSPISYLFYFLFVVVLLLGIGFTLRVISLMQSSSFNSKSYNVYVGASQPYVVAIKKDTNKIAFIDIPTATDFKNMFDLQYRYGLPIDAVYFVDKKSSDLFSLGEIFTAFSPTKKGKLIGMNVFDLLRVYFFQLGIAAQDREEITGAFVDGRLSLSEDELYSMLSDADIVAEAKSIEIVNATERDGLASGVSGILLPLGVNIISLVSEDTVTTSSIKVTEDSKTAKRISHLLEVPVEKEKTLGSADIVIVLGEDFLKRVE